LEGRAEDIIRKRLLRDTLNKLQKNMIVKRKEKQITLGVGPDEVKEKDIGLKSIKSIIQNKINFSIKLNEYLLKDSLKSWKLFVLQSNQYRSHLKQ
jgi:hypothetical protein